MNVLRGMRSVSVAAPGCLALVVTLAMSSCVGDGDDFFERDPEVDLPPGVVADPLSPSTADDAADEPSDGVDPDGTVADDPGADRPPADEPGGVDGAPDDAPAGDDAPPDPPQDVSPPADDEGVPPLVDATFECPAGFVEFGEPERVTGLGLESSVFGPVLSADGTTLVLSSIPGAGEDEDIFIATRSEVGVEFSAATVIEGLDVDGSTEGTPFLTADGLSLYFFSTRPGPGVQGDRDIWVAERESRDAPFGEPVVVPGVNFDGLDHLPWVSEDNLTLMLVSTRPSPNGASNIWVSQRVDVSDPFSTPVEVEGVNTPDRDEGFTVSRDGLTIILGSNRQGAQGMDLWMATRPDPGAAFGEPENLTTVNSAAEDIDASLSSDERELFFASDRNGVMQIFRSFRDCAPE